MDPVSVIGVLGSVISVGEVVGTSIKKLTELKSVYRHVPFMTTSLIGQLHIIQAALNQLASTWNARNFRYDPRYRHLARQIGTALESFTPLMLTLQEKLQNVNVERDLMTVKSKVSFLWKEKEMDRYFTLVDRQINALNLLIQAVQCNTWAEQQRVIDNDESQSILQLARDCSSSIIGMPDQESIITENTDDISAKFEFDALILGCRPYMSAHRSHLRQAIRSSRPMTYFDVLPTNDNESMFPEDVEGVLARGINSSTTRPISPATVQEAGSFNWDFGGTNTLEQLPPQPVPAIDASAARSTSPIIINEANPLTLESGNKNAVEQPSAQPKFDVVKEIFELLGEIASAAADIRSSKTFPNTIRNAIRPRSRQNEANHSATITKLHIKTLILGASESGKTTLMDGLRPLMRQDHSINERVDLRETVIHHLVESFQNVLEAMEDEEYLLQSDQNKRHVGIIMASRGIEHDELLLEVNAAIKSLWVDKGFQTVYERCREDDMYKNLEHFVYSIEKLEKSDYVPSIGDILRLQRRSVGIYETKFSLHATTQVIVDIAGSRSQRRKWIHCFENVGLIIFVADATAYNKSLFEDWNFNKMQEQLIVFEHIVNSSWFTHTRFLLVFSHMDVLEQRLSKSHPALCFPDFKPGMEQRPPTVDEYMQFLENRFISLIVSAAHREKIRIVRANLVDYEALEARAKELLQMA